MLKKIVIWLVPSNLKRLVLCYAAANVRRTDMWQPLDNCPLQSTQIYLFHSSLDTHVHMAHRRLVCVTVRLENHLWIWWMRTPFTFWVWVHESKWLLWYWDMCLVWLDDVTLHARSLSCNMQPGFVDTTLLSSGLWNVMIVTNTNEQ